jgi:hypothetical protein
MMCAFRQSSVSGIWHAEGPVRAKAEELPVEADASGGEIHLGWARRSCSGWCPKMHSTPRDGLVRTMSA